MSTTLALIDPRAALDLPAGPARYLMYLAGYAHPDGLTYVSRERAAADLKVHENTISKWRTVLEAGGWIVREGGRAHRGSPQLIRLDTARVGAVS